MSFAQLTATWRTKECLAIAEEAVVELESFILQDQGCCAKTFTAELEKGKDIKTAFATALQKKGGGRE
jgi:hypothetical protein